MMINPAVQNVAQNKDFVEIQKHQNEIHNRLDRIERNQTQRQTFLRSFLGNFIANSLVILPTSAAVIGCYREFKDDSIKSIVEGNPVSDLALSGRLAVSLNSAFSIVTFDSILSSVKNGKLDFVDGPDSYLFKMSTKLIETCAHAVDKQERIKLVGFRALTGVLNGYIALRDEKVTIQGNDIPKWGAALGGIAILSALQTIFR